MDESERNTLGHVAERAKGTSFTCNCCIRENRKRIAAGVNVNLHEFA